MFRDILFFRFPSKQQVIPVYSLIFFFDAAWAIYNFVAHLSNFSLYATPGDLISTFAYIMLMSFVESVLVILALLLLSFALPPYVLKQEFICRGSLLICFVFAFMFCVELRLTDMNFVVFVRFMKSFSLIFPLGLLAIYLMSRLVALKRIVEDFADRTIVFLYLLLPLTLTSLFTVILNNIF